MTRIIVKNLPDSVTSEKLKEKFSLKGQITDVQLKYASDGKFRHFGFIGFKTDEEADEALKYFHNTYVGSCKIQVERCVNLGDSKRRPNANKTLPNITESKPSTKPKPSTDADEEIDPEFSEFLEIHSNRQKDKSIWDNDGIDGDLSKNIKKKTTENDVASEDDVEDNIAHNPDLSDLEYLKSKVVGSSEGTAPKLSIASANKSKTTVEYFTVKVRGFPCQAKKKDIRQFFAPQKPDSIRLPPKVKGVAYVGFTTEIEWKRALNKNRSFHEGHRILVNNYEKKNSEPAAEPKGKGKKEEWTKQEEDMKKEETVAESGRIFIRNLAYSVTEEELEALFTPFGPLAEIHLPIDKHSRKVKGFAFVTYVMPEHAVKAYTNLDGTVFQGRMLHLIASKSKPSDEDAEGNDSSNFKQKKLKEQKAQASSSHNWNTLFLGANAVATLMAERYDTTKQQVLLEGDGQNNSVAVRLALGETQLVAETKQFLCDNGIHLEVFNEAPKLRSKTVILVKNLDAQSTVEEIRDLFSPFGELGRVLLPPRGVTAIVEFLEPAESKVAFRKLAYSKFRHMPLYLEWAPVNVFKTAPPPSRSKKDEPADGKESVTTSVATAESSEPSTKTDHVEEAEEDGEPDPETTLFVKNLNFSTTDEILKEHFCQCGSIFSATVAKKKDSKNPGQVLSMGYGFVQFWQKEGANSALKTLQNSKLDGHVIELKRSNRVSDGKDHVKATSRKTSKNQEPISSKLLVRNVPFEAKWKEVAELFKPFGELKSVRMPKKSVGSGSHRGFAFVEYITKQDAKKAFESLSVSTHLYGRRLVLEWAAAEESVDDVRRRTTAHFPGGGPPEKRSKAEVSELGNVVDSD